MGTPRAAHQACQPWGPCPVVSWLGAGSEGAEVEPHKRRMGHPKSTPRHPGGGRTTQSCPHHPLGVMRMFRASPQVPCPRGVWGSASRSAPLSSPLSSRRCSWRRDGGLTRGGGCCPPWPCCWQPPGSASPSTAPGGWPAPPKPPPNREEGAGGGPQGRSPGGCRGPPPPAGPRLSGAAGCGSFPADLCHVQPFPPRLGGVMPRGWGTRASAPMSVPTFGSRFNDRDGERRSHLLAPELPDETLTKLLRDTRIQPQDDQRMNGQIDGWWSLVPRPSPSPPAKQRGLGGPFHPTGSHAAPPIPPGTTLWPQPAQSHRKEVSAERR